MPEHIRALIVILFLSFIVFFIAKRTACQIIPIEDYNRRRNLWFVITALAFLAHNFWIYVLISSVIILFSIKKENHPIALFFILIFAFPTNSVPIPGIGLANFLFSLSHQRLLILIILLPIFFNLLDSKSNIPFGAILPDKLIGLFIALVILLNFRGTSLTDVLRSTLYQFMDVFLPYFVISRSLKSISDFRHVLLAFTLAAMLMAMIAVFEITMHWLVYLSLLDALGVQGSNFYLSRSGFVRAIVTTGQPIVLSYVLAVAMGLYLYLQQLVSSKFFRRLGLILLLAGLFASLSRGPWVGAVFIIVVFIATGRKAIPQLSKFAIAGVITIAVLGVFPGGEKIYNLIPFIGETEKGNITYREKLIENSIIVIMRNPVFGSIDYLETDEMEEMRQGQGIIDIVNSYIGITLEWGIVGLSLFTGFFISICLGIFKSLKSITTNYEEHLLGRALLSTILGIMLIIFTVSSISVISIVYWSIAGMGVAYINMIKNNKQSFS